MQQDTKEFLQALDTAGNSKLIWYGRVPTEIRELFDKSRNPNFQLFGVSVEIKPKFVVGESDEA